jgi:dTDP-4-dehydrorhamnose reductase
MKLLITGAAGQLGTELLPLLQPMAEVVAADIVEPQAQTDAFRRLDITDAALTGALLDEIRPDVIVNAAAFTAVDKAESEVELAREINAAAPGRLARWAKENDAFLLHYSTDYVFDGKSGQPYQEDDEPSPLNAYGASKLEGEKAVQDSGCAHVIIRTAWIYSAHGNNFLRTMLRMAGERSHLSVVNDQHGCPTWARNLARVSRVVIERMCANGEGASDSASAEPSLTTPDWGVYHYCDSPATTWYDFAESIFRCAAALGLLKKLPAVEPVTSDRFQTAAMRPRNSVLDTRKIERAFRIEAARRDTSMQACLEEMSAED